MVACPSLIHLCPIASDKNSQQVALTGAQLRHALSELLIIPYLIFPFLLLIYELARERAN